MKLVTTVATAWLFCLLPVFAQDWAKQSLDKSPRHQEWVTVKHGNRVVRAFMVYPEAKQKVDAVVVIHEIFGLTDWTRSVADQLAAAGYIAIAPDLLSGAAPKGGNSSDFPSVDAAREAVSNLDSDAITADLDAVTDYVKKLPAANGKVAVAGFCWGGGQSFRFATHRRDLSAAFVFYGPPPENVVSINAPIYGFYGGNDARITATVPATTEAMKAAHKKFEPVIYEGAGHGFMRIGEDPTNTVNLDANQKAANQKARAEAWQRWLALLKSM